MPSAPVADNAKLIAGSYSKPFIVRNESTVNVYLGQDSSLTVSSRAFTLTPGASLNWGASTELWAITDAGANGSIEWLYDSDSSFTPGPSNVNVSGSVVALGELTLLTTLSVLGTTPATGGTPIQATQNSIDVTGYNSVYLAIETSLIPSISTLLNGNYVTLSVDFLMAARVRELRNYTAQYLFSRSLGGAYLHVPVIGPLMDILVSLVKLVTADQMTFTVTVYGSSVPIDRPRYFHSPDAAPGNGDLYTITRAASSGAASSFIQSRNGPATIGLYSGAVAGKEVALRSVSNGVAGSIFDRVSTTASRNDDTPHLVNFPMTPILVETLNSSAGAADIAITQP